MPLVILRQQNRQRRRHPPAVSAGGGPPEGEYDQWLARATENAGSWWPYWLGWIKKQSPERVPAREPGGGKLEPLGDAPGEYVKVKA